MTRKRITWVVAGVATLALLAVPAVAQEDDAEMMDDAAVEVAGVEYAFVGLPTSVPAGTEVTFRNDGIELHEIAIGYIPETTTESIEELVAMGPEAVESGKVELLGPLFAGPGETAEGSLALETEGQYVALCFIPQGFDPAVLAAAGVDMDELELGPDVDPASLPPEVQAIMANPPHLAAGMIQTFTVTAEGTEPGPLPQDTMEEEEAA